MNREYTNLMSELFLNIIEFEQERHNEFHLGAPHNFFGLVIEGRARFSDAQNDFVVGPGEVVYIPKGCVYTSHWYPDKNVRFYSLGFRFLNPEQHRNYALQKVEGYNGLSEVIEKMYQESAYPYEAVSIFYHLFGEAEQHLKREVREKKHMSVYPAVRYIREHCCEEFNVADLAELCNMSEPHFYSVFKSEMSCSPVKYKNRLKCTRAVELLMGEDDTLEVICSRLNFSSPAFLRKLLKQELGKTPTQIRKEKYTI